MTLRPNGGRSGYTTLARKRAHPGWVNGTVRFSSENNYSGVPIEIVDSSSGSNPSVKSKANVVALVRKDPKEDAPFVQPLQGSAEASGLFELSPRWYQVQLGNRQRGWVRASQVTGRNTNSLLTRKPRLRRGPGGREAVPVRRGPGSTDATVATIAAGNTDWRALLARDAAYAGWWQIRCDEVVGWVHKDYVQTHGSLGNLAVTWNRPQLSLLATTTDGLNVRSGPGTTHDRIASIAGGSTTRYDILGKDAATATWYQIRFSDEVTGWVSATYIQTHGDLTELTVTWNQTGPHPGSVSWPPPRRSQNVRSGPAGPRHRGTIFGGSNHHYDILGKDAARPPGTISGSVPEIGWVSRPLRRPTAILRVIVTLDTAPVEPPGTTTQNLNVRSGPGTTHKCRRHHCRRFHPRYESWQGRLLRPPGTKIQFSSTCHRLVAKGLHPTHGSLSGLTVTWTPPQLSLLATTTRNLNVRSGPGTSHGIVGTIAGGSTTRYDILGKNAATATWWQIRFSSTVTGWVFATYVQTHGDVSGVPVR